MMTTQTLDFPKQLSTLDKTSRSIAFSCLNKLSVGTLSIVEEFAVGDVVQRERFGEPQSGQPAAVIIVRNPAFYSRLLKGGSIAAAESYMDGWWETPDLTALMELMALNMGALDTIENRSSFLSTLLNKFNHWLNRNTVENSEKNISAHYDLSNELYQTFLDENMLYSSALFQSPSDSLAQAQINKMERLCQQLQLKATDHVIEIGTGWGAMAIYMAQTYGCKVTTTTISDAQFDYAKDKIEQLGLSSQITLLKQDYRLLTGEFDKLVSIEMIEAVGKAFLPSYIRQCQSLLKPQGLMAIQAITIADQRYKSYSNSVDFIQKYIFPGGFLPSITALTQAATTNSDLVVRDLFDIGEDYGQTLHCWRQAFNQHLDTVKTLGFDERFIRMWNYYFCYCEGGFRAKTISTVHMTFQRP
ncbi:SAM-dependent methyltransferase [Vibrio renipiscarius]|uniref:Cyclopropane-fatty-acyl-phospholipid synthase n=1 Tax=Vibrio renipiscarius TaxID=1461322 RepID=A0A0C2JW16_9VIBR|nr:cyclopropane-fatty-acyl-phospholipid synthase family protein [Vibrio renipiscarius]KII75863.1 cyclopropane-fatty-acyl-phospholipid synthase [Vibrio renipiscarius]KII82114.1 cyclopropane-fatty-acyl-phospholipid synthase [Vibrio renipiscarius]